MAHTIPGFVDHHTHLLRVAAGVDLPCDATDPSSVADYHRRISERWSTPMDEPERPLTVDDALRGQLERALDRAAELGLAQVTEAGMHDWAYLDALRDLRQRGPLPTRVRLFVASGIADVDHSNMAKTGDPMLEIEGVKLYADGWLGPRTCAMCQPFADDEENTGVLFLDADTLAKRADPFAERGWTLATHAIGDRAVEAVLDAYDKIYGSDCAEAAPRVEHAQVLNADLIRRFASQGVVACIQPGFAVSDAVAARTALGEERLEHAYRWDLLLDAGARLIAGSDFPIESLSPLKGLQRLVTGAELERPHDQVAPPLDIERALALVTDATAGTTTLSDDPAAADPAELHHLEVVEVAPAEQ